MTARDGFPRDMGRYALDAGTAERLVTGAIDVDDAPPEYRAVAATLQSLREAPAGAALVGEPAAVERIAAAVVIDRRANHARRSRRPPARLARLAVASVVACGLALTTGLAMAGALPESAQRVASTVLRKVGISVPTGGEKPADHQPPATTSGPAPTTSGPPATTGSVPTTTGPAPTTTSSVQSNPTSNAPVAPASPPDSASSTLPQGNGLGDLHGTRARGAPPPTPKDSGSGHTPNGVPQSGSGNGNGNSNGHEKAK